MIESEVHFCPRCGQPVTWADRFGRLRPTCLQCDWVFFPDPKVAVAALVMQEGKVLLVQRTNPPFQGFWTLPAGFVDAGEDPALALERECLEEAGLSVQTRGLLDVISGQAHARGADILIVFRAEVISGSLTPGDDAGQAVFFPLDRLPPLAFPSTQSILDRFT